MKNKSGLVRFLLVGYGVAAGALLLYSFTQVDLNLTITQMNIWQRLQTVFQYIGFYQRPLSTAIYCAILLLFFGLYLCVLRAARNSLLSSRDAWKIIFVVSALLVLSYPAFSYDIYNYMFTAKTVLVYGKNPYGVIPLQFLGIDPYLNFMRWTHLPSAYTPVWIFLTLPVYLLGFNVFLVTLWNFKLLVAGFYLAATWGIGKILERLEPDQKTTGMVLFALNPLILIESLVSAHNDVVMMAVVLLAWVLYLRKKTVASFFLLSVSVATKLMSGFLLPVFFLRWNRVHALIAMTVGFVLVCVQREVLPWYFVWIAPFVALLPRKTNITLLATALSLGLLLRYVHPLLFGPWGNPAPTLKLWVTILPVGVTAVVLLLKKALPTPKTR